MKIMNQGLTMIIEQPGCVWVEQHPSNNHGIVASNSKRAPELGTYPTFERAREVLAELFEYQRNGKCSFYMPRE